MKLRPSVLLLYIPFILVVMAMMTACDASLWLVPGGDSATKAPTEQTALETTSGGSTAIETTSDNPETETGSSESTGTTKTGGTASAPGSTTSSAKKTTTTTATYPKPDTGKEMRAAWVSCFELDDLIVKKTVNEAKAVIDDIMINCKAYGLNAVIFHARSHSNAYYKSTVFNSATSVKNLISSGFDPLEYAVNAAHSRGLELHAWVNPYRIGSDKSFAKCNDYFKSGSNYFYNPASNDAQKLIVSGVEEIVKNYNVDGIHFDDYFYPPDLSSLSNDKFYNDYKSKGGTMSVENWRRDNVSRLIKAVYSKVHSIKSRCVFGVSPRGVQSQNYGTVFADVELWMSKKGYVDYVCPQVYFGFKHKTQAFDKNVDSWIKMPRHSSVRLFIGLGLYKIGIQNDEFAGTGRNEWSTNDDIMKRSLLYVRSKPECGGVMFFSYSFFKPLLKPDSSSWSKDIARREVENLLAVMKP